MARQFVVPQIAGVNEALALVKDDHAYHDYLLNLSEMADEATRRIEVLTKVEQAESYYVQADMVLKRAHDDAAKVKAQAQGLLDRAQADAEAVAREAQSVAAQAAAQLANADAALAQSVKQAQALEERTKWVADREAAASAALKKAEAMQIEAHATKEVYEAKAARLREALA